MSRGEVIALCWVCLNGNVLVEGPLSPVSWRCDELVSDKDLGQQGRMVTILLAVLGRCRGSG